MSFDQSKLADFPTLPGVYIMKRSGGQVLYVGKAINLKSRVKQYFSPGGDGRTIIPFLIKHIDLIETIVVNSEKEALLLENTLIKKHKPKYNALLKDDKTYISLKVTTKHPWPRVEVVRSKEKPKADALYFGPYTSALAARQTLELIQKLFPLRQCSDQELLRRTRPCILYDMKRCIAPCVNLCTHEEYDRYVDSTIKFLKGHEKDVIKNLKEAMDAASEKLEFERAGDIYRTIQQIEATLETQKVHRQMGGDLDALAIYREGEDVILSRLVVRDGKLQGSFTSNFNRIAEDDHELYVNYIIQHYTSDVPDEILVPVPLSDAPALEEILKAKIVTPQKGDKKAIVNMALVNAQTTFKKDKDAQTLRDKALLELQDKLRLTRYPKTIECIDNSNLSGSEAVSAIIAFTNGTKDKSRYRKFKIKTASFSDDYGMMREVLERRYKKAKEENNLPDLILIDGGKGHLNMAINVLEGLDIASVDLISIAKDEGRHDRGITQEQIFLRNVKDPVLLKTHSPALFMLQNIRDEAHRFAITFQKNRRTKTLIRSALDDIPGIGPSKRKNLLTHFGSLQKISNATPEELSQVKGISAKDIAALTEFFNKSKE